MMRDLSEEELISRCREGSQQDRRTAANELFGRHYERVGRWCYRFTGDRESAADLAQDVFAKAYRYMDKFEGSSKFTTWLYTIVRNECLNAARSRKAAKEESGEEMFTFLPDTSANAHDELQKQEATRRMHALLNSALDETERVVFTMHYGDDVPLEAITRALRLDNASGAKAYIVSAKRKLGRAVERLKARGAH